MSGSKLEFGINSWRDNDAPPRAPQLPGTHSIANRTRRMAALPEV
jgi:hypothetical protein